MNRICTTVSLVAFLALLSAGPAFTQTLSDEAAPEKKAAARVAFVYAQTNEGLNVYDAAANGKLTLVKGSPFHTAGTWMEASNGKYLFNSDGYRIHTFVIESDGAIGKQVAEINTRDFDGADCSGSPSMTNTVSAVLDHTGKSLYVQIVGYGPDGEGGTQLVCSALQSYQVSASGKLRFNGAYIWSPECCVGSLTFTGNDHFVFGVNCCVEGGTPAISYFVREPNGALNNFNGSAEAPPPPPPSAQFGDVDWMWQPNLVEADPSGHLAVMGIFEADTFDGGISSGRKLASYTVGPTGDLVTTNTYVELATPAITPLTLNMSPSGSFLAAGGEDPYLQNGGLQIFHFNGAAPITAYSASLGPSEPQAIHWDNNDHLYAIGGVSGTQLYVYTVTASEISEAPGSPYEVNGALEGAELIVVPKLEASVRAVPLNR